MTVNYYVNEIWPVYACELKYLLAPLLNMESV